MMDNGFRIYTPYQITCLNRELAVLAEYRDSGLTPQEAAEYHGIGLSPAQVRELARAQLDPAPEPLDLYGDLHVGAGLLDSDDYSPAAAAQGAREEGQWNK